MSSLLWVQCRFACLLQAAHDYNAFAFNADCEFAAIRLKTCRLELYSSFGLGHCFFYVLQEL